jgi:nuclear pore complex protein Nup160
MNGTLQANSLGIDAISQPLITVSKLSTVGLFDLALTTAQLLSVDMTELFQRLTVTCIKLSSTSDPSMWVFWLFCDPFPLNFVFRTEMAASDWLLTDKVASWPGTSAERGWRYLRQSLERYDNDKSEYKYSKAVLDTLLLHDMHKSIPTWVLQRIQVSPF